MFVDVFVYTIYVFGVCSLLLSSSLWVRRRRCRVSLNFRNQNYIAVLLLYILVLYIHRALMINRVFIVFPWIKLNTLAHTHIYIYLWHWQLVTTAPRTTHKIFRHWLRRLYEYLVHTTVCTTAIDKLYEEGAPRNSFPTLIRVCNYIYHRITLYEISLVPN